MAAGSTALLDRIDVLLQDTDATAENRLSTPLVKMHASTAELIEQIQAGSTAPTAIAYLLSGGGDPSAIKDFLNAPKIMTSMNVQIDLAMYSGGIATTAATVQTIIRTLTATWKAVRALLDCSNNWALDTTGWINALQWRNTGAKLNRKDRIYTTGSFVAIYDAAPGA